MRTVEAPQLMSGSAASAFEPTGRPVAEKPSTTLRSRSSWRGVSTPRSLRVVAQLQDGQERLLGHLDPADLLHAPLALLLALEQLALAGDVAAVALGRDVLAERLDGLAGDDLRAHGGLDRHVVLLARDLLAQALGQDLALVVGLVAVHHHAQRIDRVAAEQHVELDEVGRAQADRLVVQRGVSARAGLELVEEVEHDLREREVVGELYALRGEVVHALVRAPAVLAELHDLADVLLRREDRGADVGL